MYLFITRLAIEIYVVSLVMEMLLSADLALVWNLFFVSFHQQMVEIKKCFAPKCAPFLFGSVENLQFHLAKEHRLKMTGLAGLATANVNNIKV